MYVCVWGGVWGHTIMLTTIFPSFPISWHLHFGSPYSYSFISIFSAKLLFNAYTRTLRLSSLQRPPQIPYKKFLVKIPSKNVHSVTTINISKVSMVFVSYAFFCSHHIEPIEGIQFSSLPATPVFCLGDSARRLSPLL